jgi:hypothetical protein
MLQQTTHKLMPGSSDQGQREDQRKSFAIEIFVPSDAHTSQATPNLEGYSRTGLATLWLATRYQGPVEKLLSKFPTLPSDSWVSKRKPSTVFLVNNNEGQVEFFLQSAESPYSEWLQELNNIKI